MDGAADRDKVRTEDEKQRKVCLLRLLQGADGQWNPPSDDCIPGMG